MRSSLNLQGAGLGSLILVHPFVLEPLAVTKSPVWETIEGAIGESTKVRHDLKIGLWVTLAVLAAGAWFLIRRASENGFDGALVWATISRASWGWLVAAWFLNLTSYFTRALRWNVMLRPLSGEPSVWRVFIFTIIGFSALVLFGRPGEVVRPYLIARAARVSFISQMAALLLERIYDTLTILAVFGYALAIVPHSAVDHGSILHWVFEKGGWVTGITCTICFAVLAGLQRSSHELVNRLKTALSFLEAKHQERAAHLIGAAMDGLRSARSGRSISLLFAYSSLTWILIILCFVAIFKAFPETIGLSFSSVLVFLGFIAFGSIVQIPGIGGGAQLVSMLVLTQIFHIGFEAATGISVVCWLFTFVGFLPVGICLSLREGLNWRKLKELEQTAAL